MRTLTVVVLVVMFCMVGSTAEAKKAEYQVVDLGNFVSTPRGINNNCQAICSDRDDTKAFFGMERRWLYSLVT
jgi:hypothetical protein